MTTTTTKARGRRPLVWIAAGAAVLLVVAAVGVYVLFFKDDAPSKLALDTSASAKPIDRASIPGTWKAAPGSEAGYRVREKLSILPAKSDAVGRTPAVTGSVTMADDAGTIVAKDVRFEADLTQLKSDRDLRDQRMHEVGLETDQFPRSTYVATAPTKVPPGAENGQPVKVTTEGDLTIHGKTKHVVIPLDARLTGNRIELVGSLNFPITDFDISVPSFGGFVTLDGDANLEFKLLLTK